MDELYKIAEEDLQVCPSSQVPDDVTRGKAYVFFYHCIAGQGMVWLMILQSDSVLRKCLMITTKPEKLWSS